MINVQCVYGDRHRKHLENCLIPNLVSATEQGVNFFCLNYVGNQGVAECQTEKLSVRNIQAPGKIPCGFAENHNHIFSVSPQADSFVLINPDCLPLPGCIDALLKRKTPETAIVEGRQWPFEHPKEYDSLTLETPWASFAFCLIDSEFYRQQKGMDELYFLYDEDVDLSWRAWLTGWKVLYEPAAQIMHFTDGYFARDDKISNEQFFSLRNFMLISRKFFGQEGEDMARKLLRAKIDERLFVDIDRDYRENVLPRIKPFPVGQGHKNVKILDINTFARIRTG